MSEWVFGKVWNISLSVCLFRGDGNFLKARQEAKKGELDEQLREYINEWRKQRSKEEEELHRLKEKQAKRKEIRAEQEKKLAQQKKEEEERFRKEEADKKAREAEEKRKRLEEAEKKRQMMMQAQKDKQQGGGGSGVEGGKRLVGGVSQDELRQVLTPFCFTDGKLGGRQERNDKNSGAAWGGEENFSEY